jgi:rubrerythrin
MKRSYDDFVTSRESIPKKKTIKQKPVFSNISGRGLEAFWDDRMHYYQEADEMDDNQQSGEDLNEEDFTTDDDNDELIDVDMDEAAEHMGDDTDNKAPVETDGINGTLPEEENEEESIEEIPPSDGHDEEENMKTFGQHGGDDLPNNQYDPQEVAKIMQFVSDEAKALSDYVEAAKTSKVDILQRLYSDIADEERYHMEQLLFAKAEITGEEYKPHDPDIRKEYEELLSMGMDEGSAMATAVDKFNLHVTTITPEDDDKLKIAVADVKDAIQEMDIAFLYADTINMITEYCTDDYVLDKLHEIHSPQIFQEDVNVFANNRYSVEPNPGRFLVQLFSAIHKAFQKIARAIHLLLTKNFARIKKAGEYVKDHGLSQAFAHGTKLYLWNDKSGTFEIDPILYYTNCALWACQEVARLTKMRGQYTTKMLSIKQVFDLSSVQKSQYKKKVGISMCYQYLTSMDPVKTKVVVTPKNMKAIEDQFFKSSDTGEDTYYSRNLKGGEVKNIPQMGIRVSPPLKNAFNKLDLMFQTITTFSELTKYFTGEFEDLQNDEASIFYKNKKIYNQCVDYLKGVSKGLKEMSKICSHDLNQMNELLSNISNA